MKIMTPNVRISLGLVCLTLSVILVGNLLTNPLPEQNNTDFQQHIVMLKNLAIQYSKLAENNQNEIIATAINALTEDNSSILSAGLRRVNGKMIAESRLHGFLWKKPPGDTSTFQFTQVPIFYGSKRWGTLEVSFAEQNSPVMKSWLQAPWLKFLVFVLGASFLIYLFYMRRTLEYLNPSVVVPDRVKSAFNALSEGIILLDDKGRIVLANKVFKKLMTDSSENIVGLNISTLAWQKSDEIDFPWWETLRSGLPQTEASIDLVQNIPNTKTRIKFLVNTSAIKDRQGNINGVIVSLANVTDMHQLNQALKKSNEHLLKAMQELHRSKDEVARQNEELMRLANCDFMTGFLNRRAFFARVEKQFSKAKLEKLELSCIMADIDHFKSFNDRYGHAVGDEVIIIVAKTIADSLRDSDILCRYGGEEFCLILPDTSLTETLQLAEKIRFNIETQAGPAITAIAGLKITASFGVVNLNNSMTNLSELIDRSDQALYLSKDAGRNRISQWQKVTTTDLLEQRPIKQVANL